MKRFSACNLRPPSASDSGLLATHEPRAFAGFGAGGRYPALLVCDHASARVPRALGGLGLPAPFLRRHIAWDIGAAALARGLAERLGVRGLSSGYSRLVIDCNRGLEDPSSIPLKSDGAVITGNLGLSEAGRRVRQLECFWPYHEAIEAELARLASGGCAPALIAVHSFTPVMCGIERPWHCGMLWDRDARLAVPVIAALRARGDLVVGDNEPYSGREPAGFTLEAHAAPRGWPQLCIEVRQDQLTHSAGVVRWVAILAAALEPLLADAALYRAAA